MKSRKEIEALALKEYPRRRTFVDDDNNDSHRQAFIKGIESTQEETQRLEKINAELREAANLVIAYCDRGNPFTPSRIIDNLEQALANANK